MTVQELIDQLGKIEDKSKRVLVAVHTNTQRFSVADVDINPMSGYFHQSDHDVQLYVWLPDGMRTSQYKK